MQCRSRDGNVATESWMGGVNPAVTRPLPEQSFQLRHRIPVLPAQHVPVHVERHLGAGVADALRDHVYRRPCREQVRHVRVSQVVDPRTSGSG